MLCQEGVITLKGNLDFTTAQALVPQGCQWLAKTRSVTFDLSQIDNADSAGVALLIAWWRFAKQHAVKIYFKNPPAALNALLAVTNIDHVFAECLC